MVKHNGRLHYNQNPLQAVKTYLTAYSPYLISFRLFTRACSRMSVLIKLFTTLKFICIAHFHTNAVQ